MKKSSNPILSLRAKHKRLNAEARRTLAAYAKAAAKAIVAYATARAAVAAKRDAVDEYERAAQAEAANTLAAALAKGRTDARVRRPRR